MARQYGNMAFVDIPGRFQQGRETVQRNRMVTMGMEQQEAAMGRQGRVNAMLGQIGNVAPEKRQSFLGNMASQGQEGLGVSMQLHEMWGRMDDRKRGELVHKAQQNAAMLAGVKDQDTWDLARAQAIQVNPALDNQLPMEYDPNAVDIMRRRFEGIAGLGGGAGVPAGLLEFQGMTEGLTPEQREEARLIDLGLKPRAVGASAKTVDIGGVPHVFDPVSRKMVPVSVGGEQVTAGTVATSEGAIEGEKSKQKVLGAAEGNRIVNAPKARAKLESQIRSVDNVIGTIDRVVDNVSTMTAGQIGVVASAVRGTPAYDLKQSVLTIKANLGFDRLQEMRDNSPTGGALGQVALQELEALQATVASLDIGQSPEQLIQNLELVREHYQNYKNAVQASYEDQYVRKQADQQPDGDGWSIEEVQ